MASKSHIVDSLLVECGKASAGVREEISRKVGEIALDMLQQNDGRFSALKKTETYTIATDTLKYKLPADFFAIAVESQEVDSDGAYKNIVEIVDKDDILTRKRQGAYYGYRLCYIELDTDNASGRGWYLVLSDYAPSSAIFEIDYFREPTEDDVDAIKETSLLKSGVRGALPHLFSTAEVDSYKYMNRIDKYQESPTKTRTSLSYRPNIRTQRRNQLMHRIGRGS